MTQKWKRFFFDGNLYTGLIQSSEDWKKVKEAYRVGPDPKKAKVFTGSENTDLPKFGFYMEYTGILTLGEWAKVNDMAL